MKRLHALVYFLLFPFVPIFGQIDKNDPLNIIESQQKEIEEKENIGNFDHWAYSQKKHAVVFYFAPMLQYGFNENRNIHQFHQDFGVMYRWSIIDTEKTKINFQAWAEQSSLISGFSTKKFSKELGIISPHNGSDTEDFSTSIENFFLEMFLINKKWDVTLGKFDPLFLTTFTNYSGWDKYNYFSKTAASDPVPDLGTTMGFYTEYHFSDHLSLGGIIADNQPKNDYLYIPDFKSTTYTYMGFMRVNFPSKTGLVSDHNLIYYFSQSNNENPSGKGIIYTGNQGINEKLILVLKYSYGEGLVNKLNAAYALGLTIKKPFHRSGDQFGVAGILNEKSSNYEYGIDLYYKYFVKRWFTFSPNIQVYYGLNDKLNYIPGLRAFVAY